MKYRRTRQPGGYYFFTVNLQQRNTHLLTEKIDLLRAAFRKVMQGHPFVLDSIVVLPDHLHCIWILPERDTDYPKRWSLIKQNFSRSLPFNQTEVINPSRKRRSERGIWQRRYWEHYIRDEKDLSAHRNYIHLNPVKHGYVKRPEEWEFSSIHKFQEQKILEENWGEELL